MDVVRIGVITSTAIYPSHNESLAIDPHVLCIALGSVRDIAPIARAEVTVMSILTILCSDVL